MGDWEKLPNDLLELILKYLESSFDLFRFRSVCSSWRSAAEPKRPLLTHHVPILPGKSDSLIPDSAVGFRLSQRSILLIKPHEPQCEADVYEWLIKVEEDLDVPGKMNLFNPLSNKRYSFPQHLPCVLDMSKVEVNELGWEFRLHYINSVGDILDRSYWKKVVVKYLDDDTFVLLTSHVSGYLAVFRSWDQAWTLINDMSRTFYDVILFDGRFFVVDMDGMTMVVDIYSLKLTLAASPVFGGDKKFLVESRGEMLLVYIYPSIEQIEEDPIHEDVSERQICYFFGRSVRFRHKFFKFVEREKSWVEFKLPLYTRLFLGHDCTFSAPCWGLFSVFFNSNLFSDVMADRNLGVFNFRSGEIELVYKNPLYANLFWPPPPWTTFAERGETSSQSDTCEIETSKT